MKIPLDGQKYLLQEQESIYSQGTWMINQVAILEKLALLSSGAIWAWIATQQWNELYEIIIWFPSVVVVVFFIKVFFIGLSLRKLSSYIRQVESYFEVGELGWQNWRIKHSKKFMSAWATIYWLILFITNTSIALFFPFKSLYTQ